MRFFAKNKVNTIHDNLPASKQAYFKETIENVNLRISEMIRGCNKEEKMALLKSFEKIMLLNLQSECFSDMIYRSEERQKYKNIFNMFPLGYTNSAGEYKQCPIISDDYAVDLKKHILICTPWKYRRVIDAAMRKSDFAYQANGHDTIMLESLDVILVNNGIHSILDRKLNKENTIIKTVLYDDSRLYRELFTDGAFWYERETEEKIQNLEIIDFRIAVIFKLHQMILELQLDAD